MIKEDFLLYLGTDHITVDQFLCDYLELRTGKTMDRRKLQLHIQSCQLQHVMRDPANKMLAKHKLFRLEAIHTEAIKWCLQHFKLVRPKKVGSIKLGLQIIDPILELKIIPTK